MARGRYIGFTDLIFAQAFIGRIFLSSGYTPEVQAQEKTDRYTNIIAHPNEASRPGLINHLVVVKEFQMFGPERRESIEDNIMSEGEKTLIKTAAEWEIDGFFPPDSREQT